MNIMIRKLTQDEYNNAADLSYQVLDCICNQLFLNSL